MKNKRTNYWIVAGLTLTMLGSTALAQDEASDLAKKSQNPIADMASVPIMYNMNFNAGADEHTQHTINVQPVYPTAISEDWLLINRLVVPIMNDWDDGNKWGLGDMQYQGFFSPKTGGDLTWGVGPVVQLPTSTDKVLGPREWCLGAGAIVVKTQGKWVYGGLINNTWALGNNKVNLMFIQPFVNYNLGNGLAVGFVPQISANWTADSGDQWTVPLGAQISQVKPIGGLPINWVIGAYGNVVKPDTGADWTLRLQATCMFPK